MSGGPPWSQRGTKGGGQTVAVNQRPEMSSVQAPQTASLAAGKVETTRIYAPAGSVYKVVGLDLNAQPIGSATTGTHRFGVRSMQSLTFLQGASDYGSYVTFRFGRWQNANSRERPADEASQTMLMGELMATENAPITINYKNNTDAEQTSNRGIELIVEEVSY